MFSTGFRRKSIYMSSFRAVDKFAEFITKITRNLVRSQNLFQMKVCHSFTAYDLLFYTMRKQKCEVKITFSVVPFQHILVDVRPQISISIKGLGILRCNFCIEIYMSRTQGVYIIFSFEQSTLIVISLETHGVNYYFN